MAPPAWVIVVHGGAGSQRPSTGAAIGDAYRAGLSAALRAGGELLARGGTSLDAVEAAVCVLEDDPSFNAGRGAVLHRGGGHELDAAIVDGHRGRGGAVAAVRTVRNPVRLARAVMEHTPHVLLVGDGAEAFADGVGVERVDPRWFTTPPRERQLADFLAREAAVAAGGGTVGAVALDVHGHLAAATSTGGITGKLPGRVGDTPVIGAGTWADARCAVSCTGHGEAFLLGALAARVAFAVEMRGCSLGEAADEAMRTLRPDDGGLIAVARDASVAMPFNTEAMFRGVLAAGGSERLAVGPA